jgi:hypothetical protein
MSKSALLKKIKDKAKRNARNRRDHRFLDAMGFLVAKGFLRVNFPIRLKPNIRLRIEDVVWAGLNVEPRILEVLPAAILRLPKHFDPDAVNRGALGRVIDQLRRGEEQGDDFYGMPYKKLKVWVDLSLLDKRTKTRAEKKVLRTYRLAPAVLARLKQLSADLDSTETAVIERLVLETR